MHHFRGKLLEGNRIHLDPANVYIQYHSTPGGSRQGWYGYLLVASETDVEPGGVYTLKLEDGRSGLLQIDRLAPDPSGKIRATFVGDGPLV
ncbi:MAG: hypothetical protein IRY99_22045 [Isosphaeraceae bacterium]|nr:hypothetical protein [Isosphaeraceae bacterium]